MYYLSQFRLRVIYRPSRLYTFPDTISYLRGDTEIPKLTLNKENLDPLAYYTILIEIDLEYKERLARAYENNKY